MQDSPLSVRNCDDVHAQITKSAKLAGSHDGNIILQASWNWPFDRKDMEVYGQTGSVITVRRDDVRVRREGAEEERVAAKPLPAPYDDPISCLRAVVLAGAPPDGLSSLATTVIGACILKL